METDARGFSQNYLREAVSMETDNTAFEGGSSLSENDITEGQAIGT